MKASVPSALALAALASIFASGCGGKKCGPDTCAGCCDANDLCQSSDTPHCGLQGVTCDVCGVGKSCVVGACEFAGGIGGSTSRASTSGGSASGSGSSSSSGSTGGTSTGTSATSTSTSSGSSSASSTSSTTTTGSTTSTSTTTTSTTTGSTTSTSSSSSTGTTGSGSTTGSTTTGSTTTGGTGGNYSDLLLSEYLEGGADTTPGGSVNRALEVFNGTPSDIDLGGYELLLYNNGSYVKDGGSQALRFTTLGAGALGSGQTYVVCYVALDGGTLDPCDARTNNNVLNFNGNDTLLLTFVDGGVVDSFGDGTNPAGTTASSGYWPASDGGSTQLHDLRRKCSVTSGRTDVTAPFDPAAEWELYAPSDLSDLQHYSCP